MKNIKLSGGQYGGYVVNNDIATLTETKINDSNESYDEVTDQVAVEVSENMIIINGWKYDTSLSKDNNVAEFAGMVQ